MSCYLKFAQMEELPPPQASSALGDLYERKTSDLTSEHALFFRKWERLLTLEEHENNRHRRELWTLNASDRERYGRCFAGMALDTAFQPSQPKIEPILSQLSVVDAEEGESQPTGSTADNTGRGIHRATHRFIRSRHFTPSSSAPSLLAGHISVGDPVVVSAEPLLWPGLGYHGERRGRGVLALARGFVLSLSPHEVVLGLDHFLDTRAIGERMNRAVRGKATDTVEVLFRIDREELAGGAGRLRGNLAQLFHAAAKRRTRELVVDLAPPQFEPPPEGTPVFPREHPAWILNIPQKMALDAALRTQDYALVLGMPGTGKTTMIAALIRSIVARGQTVLLASYTHSAVDNVLLKLLIDNFQILRVGNIDKVCSMG
jgi:DNA replication ATP-dependent helicase Dna2